VTVASTKIFFFLKLELFKIYLRPVSKRRLNGLTTLCIQEKILDEINMCKVMVTFFEDSGGRSPTEILL
jgi:hypothetical protein